MRKNPIQKYCTQTGAAELAGVTEGAIRKAVSRGDLDGYQTGDGRVRLLLISDVEAWARVERRTGPKPAN